MSDKCLALCAKHPDSASTAVIVVVRCVLTPFCAVGWIE